MNVARDKTAYQSSYLSGHEKAASRGVDGVTQQDGYNIIHTDTGQPYTWWEVDLQYTYFIRDVKIYFRTDCMYYYYYYYYYYIIISSSSSSSSSIGVAVVVVVIIVYSVRKKAQIYEYHHCLLM